MNDLVWFVIATLPWLVYFLLREPRPKWVDDPDSPGLWWHRLHGVDNMLGVEKNLKHCWRMGDYDSWPISTYTGKWQKVAGPYG